MKRPREEFTYRPLGCSHEHILNRLDKLEKEESVVKHDASPEAHPNILSKLHVHNNQLVIDKFCEANGKLMFDGNEIAIGSGTGESIDDAAASSSTVYSSLKVSQLLEGKQDKIAYTPEDSASKNKINGYAGLDASGKIAVAQLPDAALYQTYIVADESARLALTNVKAGEHCYETTSGRYYIQQGTEWVCLSEALKAQNTSVNNLNAVVNPLPADDESAGYAAGSLWVNQITKECFICIDAASEHAKWHLIGGQTKFSVPEIIPFVYDEQSQDRISGQTVFYLPAHRHDKSYLELSRNGVELVEGKDYVVQHDAVKDAYYVQLDAGIDASETIHGEIFQSKLVEAKTSEVKRRTIERSASFNDELETIIDVPALMLEEGLDMLLSSEITLKNSSEADTMHLTVQDGLITLIDEDIPSGSVQKYDLGISPKTKVVVSGNGHFNYYLATI